MQMSENSGVSEVCRGSCSAQVGARPPGLCPGAGHRYSIHGLPVDFQWMYACIHGATTHSIAYTTHNKQS